MHIFYYISIIVGQPNQAYAGYPAPPGQGQPGQQPPPVQYAQPGQQQQMQGVYIAGGQGGMPMGKLHTFFPWNIKSIEKYLLMSK